MKVSSDKLQVNGDPAKAYRRISNFSELGGMMPSQGVDGHRGYVFLQCGRDGSSEHEDCPEG